MTTTTKPKRQSIPFKPQARTIQLTLTETRTHTFTVTVPVHVSAEQVEEALQNEVDSHCGSLNIESVLKRHGIEADSSEIDDVDFEDAELSVESDTVDDDVEMYVIRRKLDDGSYEYFVKKNGTLDNTHIKREATLFLNEPTNIIEGMNLFNDGSKWEIHVVNEN